MRTRVGSLLFALLLSAGGCSGGVKYRIDDAVLADVPVGEKQQVLAAKAEVDSAMEEKNKAQSDIATAEHDVSVAESDYAQAKLEVSKAQADLDLAQQGKDINNVNTAKSRLATARLGKQVADAKVDWQKGRRKLARAQGDVAERHIIAASARYELEKARLAQQKGKRPSPDFNVASYEAQAADAQRKYDEARAYADQQQVAVTQLEQRYNTLSAQYNQTRSTTPGTETTPQPGYPNQGYPGQPNQGYPNQPGPNQGYPGQPNPGYPNQPGYPEQPQQPAPLPPPNPVQPY